MTAPQDPFGLPERTSQYPTFESLEGSLVLFTPTKLESVPQPPKYGGGMKDRITTNAVVFGPDGEEVYRDMYVSNNTLSVLRAALQPGGKPMILGIVQRIPTADAAEKLKIETTPEAYTEARAAWLKGGGKGDAPGYAWILAEYTVEQAARVRAYIDAQTAASNPFAPAAQ